MASPNDLFDRAVQLQENGDGFGSLEVWRQLRRLHPDPGALCRLARVAKEFGNDEEAKSALLEAIRLDASFRDAHLGLATIAIAEGTYQQAKEFLEQAIEIQREPIALCMLGFALSELQREDEARTCYKMAIELDSQYEEAYYNLGVLEAVSSPQEAERLFALALDFDPHYAMAHRELGWLLRRAGRFPEAENHLRRAINITPDDAWAHIYLGNLCWSQCRYDETLDEFRLAIEAAPNWAYPLCCVANFYEYSEDWQTAQDFYARALNLEPDDITIHMNLARMLRKMGDLAGLRTQFQLVLLLDPDNKEARTQLADLVDRTLDQRNLNGVAEV